MPKIILWLLYYNVVQVVLFVWSRTYTLLCCILSSSVCSIEVDLLKCNSMSFEWNAFELKDTKNKTAWLAKEIKQMGAWWRLNIQNCCAQFSVRLGTLWLILLHLVFLANCLHSITHIALGNYIIHQKFRMRYYGVHLMNYDVIACLHSLKLL